MHAVRGHLGWYMLELIFSVQNEKIIVKNNSVRKKNSMLKMKKNCMLKIIVLKKEKK